MVRFLLLLVTVATCNYYARYASEITLPHGFHTLPEDVQQALLRDTSHITDVQAEIRQTIHQQGIEEKRRGYYWADNRGRFRLQFFVPDELVVFDGEKLYWYIAANGFSWVLASDDLLKPQIPTQPIWLSHNFSLEYQEPWGARFWPRDMVRFRVRNREMEVELRYSRRVRAIVARQLYDSAGNIVLKEEFSEPVDCAGQPFFQRVRVFAGQGKFKVSNDTEYLHPICNRGLSDTLFHPPKGEKKVYRP